MNGGAIILAATQKNPLKSNIEIQYISRKHFKKFHIEVF